MFEELDDTEGAPDGTAHRAGVEQRARRLQVRRRAGLAVAGVALLLPIAIALAVARDSGHVDVAAEAPQTTVDPSASAEVERSTTSEVTSTTETTSTTAATGTTTTTMVLEPTTTTTVPPTTTTTGPPTFDPRAYDLVAHLDPQDAQGAAGNAGAKQLGPTTWRIMVVVEHLVPGRDHTVLVHRPAPDGGTPFPTACAFTADAQGRGSCTGDVEMPEGGAPENASVMAYDDASRGYKTISYGAFAQRH